MADNSLTKFNSMAGHIDPEVSDLLSRVNQFFQERQISAYLVGGFVRDFLIGRSTADIDLAVAADALQFGRELADVLGGTFVLLDAANRIARVVLQHWCLDLSTIASDIQQDLARRDFTVNSLAVDLRDFTAAPDRGVIIDPFNGQADLQNRLIRAVNETVFQSDPARLLRALRLSAELGFNITEKTCDLIRHDHKLIAGVAGERVREELLRILEAPLTGQYVRMLDDLGLLTVLIPELETSRGVEQPKEHHWDVLNHSLETVQAADFLLRRGKWVYVSDAVLEEVPWSEKLKEHFETQTGSGSTHASLMKLAALLHDIAKPETRIISKERVRFFGHTEQGAETAVQILERLRFSNKEVRLVEVMVRYHLRPTQMSHEGMPSQRAIYRYFRDTGTAGIDILFLSLADHLAARGPDLELDQWKWHAGQVNCILTDCFQRESILEPVKLIDGHDLIQQFGLKPGPRIREILEAVKEAQAGGELTTRDEALYYVKNRLLYREQNLEE